MSPATESKAGVGAIEGAFYALCSAIVWIVFNAFVFISSYIVVTETDDEIPWAGWASITGVVLIPLVPLTVLTVRRIQQKPFIPSTTFGRQLFIVQLLGVGFMAAAIVVPPTFLWSHAHPGVDLFVSNQSDYPYEVRIYGYSGNCVGNATIEAGVDQELVIKFPSDFLSSCDGASVEEIELRSSVGMWECAWPIAPDYVPFTLSNDGPICDVIDSYRNPVFNPSPPFAEP